jgi:hypothetical protein
LSFSIWVELAALGEKKNAVLMGLRFIISGIIIA